MGVFGGIGYYCKIKAFTLSEASAIALYSYTGGIFASFWGILLFNDYPDIKTCFGEIVIVTA